MLRHTPVPCAVLPEPACEGARLEDSCLGPMRGQGRACTCAPLLALRQGATEAQSQRAKGVGG
eukprot:241519-Alexandrium_andersonii.AAC.1